MASLKNLLLYNAAILGMMSNEFFTERKDIKDHNKQHQAWKEAQNLRIQKLNKEHRPKQVFSIHGIMIEATSRKDAIKIYMFQLKRQ